MPKRFCGTAGCYRVSNLIKFKQASHCWFHRVNSIFARGGGGGHYTVHDVATPKLGQGHDLSPSLTKFFS